MRIIKIILFKFLLPIGVVATLTIATFNSLYDLMEDQRQLEFKTDAIKEAYILKKNFRTSMEVIHSIQAFYKASNYVSIHEFKIFVEKALKTHPSIKSLEWVPAIKHSDKYKFIQESQKIHPNFNIIEKSEDKLLPATTREIYYPILYIEPKSDNQEIIGFDLGSEEKRLEALEEARDSGQVIISDVIQLIQDSNQKQPNGLLMIAPIYSKDDLTNIHARRQSIKGFALSVFEINKLISQTTNIYHNNDKIQLKQITSNSTLPETYNKNTLNYFEKIELGGKNWTIHIQRSPKTTLDNYTIIPYLGTSILFLLISIFYTWIFFLKNRQANSDKIITEKTKEISFTNEMLHSIQNVQRQFITEAHTEKYFETMLKDLLFLTDSEFGFIGEVLYDKNEIYLKTFSITNIAWDYDTRKFYEDHAPDGLEFKNNNTLFGACLTSGEVIISNDPENDPRSGGTPPGHPKLLSFMGMPLYANNRLVGMAGVANREDGYNEEIANQLAPFIANCGYIINEHKIRIEHKKIEEVNYTLARFDPLTEIPNRTLFEKEFEKLIKLAERNNHKLGMLFIDLDGFKEANDNYGHDIGDIVLKNVAKILQRSIREGDFIARIGGDEFSVILPMMKNTNEAIIVAEKLLKLMQKPLMIVNQPIQIGMSIGIAVFPTDSHDSKTTFQNADKAMYQAKSNGKNQYCCYSDINKDDSENENQEIS